MRPWGRGFHVAPCAVVPVLVCVALLLDVGGLQAFAAGETSGKHWVYDELAEFKQRIRPIAGGDSQYTGITGHEKNAIRSHVLNEEYLDDPIGIEDWAILLKAVLKIPALSRENPLGMYAYGLATGDHIAREDAVGGMVKLLTLRYLKGSGSAEELAPANALKDLDALSDRQGVLVRMAYSADLVDSQTTDHFRPRDMLTVAEAVSILNRVIAKFNISYDEAETGSEPPPAPVRTSWVDEEVQEYRDRLQGKLVALKTAESILVEGPVGDDRCMREPVTAAKWAEALEHTLGIRDQQLVRKYTAGLVQGDTVPRGVAVAGLLKLLHYAGMLEARDASEKELLQAAAAFSDFAGAFDTSKLAIAYCEGLVRGYPDGSFRPGQPLTKGEALQLMLNVIERFR